MTLQDIQRFSELRYKARAYICYLFSKNLPNRLPGGVNAESIKSGFDKMAHEIEGFDAFYALDANGVQIGDTVSLNEKYKAGGGENCSNKSYYYAAILMIALSVYLFATEQRSLH